MPGTYSSTQQKVRPFRIGGKWGCNPYQEIRSQHLTTEVVYRLLLVLLVLWWYCSIIPNRTSVQQIIGFFMFFQRDKGFLLPAIKGYWVALNHLFSLAEMISSSSFSSILATSCSAWDFSDPQDLGWELYGFVSHRWEMVKGNVIAEWSTEDR